MIEVRRARLEDMGDVLRFLEQYHKTSNMRDIKFVKPDAAKVLEHYTRATDCYASVAVRQDTNELVGVLYGCLQPFFINSRKTWASDLMFISHGAGPKLLREWKEWAFGMGASKIIMGVSSGDPRADKILELSGFESTGGMYVIHR